MFVKIAYKWRFADDPQDDWEYIEAFDMEDAARELGKRCYAQDPECTEFDFVVASPDFSEQRQFRVEGEWDINFSAWEKSL